MTAEETLAAVVKMVPDRTSKFQAPEPIKPKKLAADPTDALMHLYVGSAYMSMGKMKEAKEAFNDCVRQGKGPSVAECQAFGGKK